MAFRKAVWNPIRHGSEGESEVGRAAIRRDGIMAHRDVCLWGRTKEEKESEELGLCH